MKIKSVKVEFSFTKNLGNYNSIKINEGLEAELSENDNLNDVREELYTNIKESIKQQLEKVKK